MFEFNPLKIPQKRLSTSGGSGVGYKVFTSSDDFEIVEAETAAEAIEKSGVEEPLKVMRIFGAVHNVIEAEELESVSEETQEEVASGEETA